MYKLYVSIKVREVSWQKTITCGDLCGAMVARWANSRQGGLYTDHRFETWTISFTPTCTPLSVRAFGYAKTVMASYSQTSRSVKHTLPCVTFSCS